MKTGNADAKKIANGLGLQDPYLRADQMYQDVINARTFSDIQATIDAAATINYDTNPHLFKHNYPQGKRIWLLVLGVAVDSLLRHSFNLQDSARKKN